LYETVTITNAYDYSDTVFLMHSTHFICFLLCTI